MTETYDRHSESRRGDIWSKREVGNFGWLKWQKLGIKNWAEETRSP